MNHHSPAPTGHAVKAQGNALGMPPKIGQALKGRNIASAGFMSTPPSSAPSGREFILTIAPRALPWAIACRPFGAATCRPFGAAACRPFGAAKESRE